MKQIMFQRIPITLILTLGLMLGIPNTSFSKPEPNKTSKAYKNTSDIDNNNTSNIEKLLEDKNYKLVYIYTDWCKYCKKMKQTTLKNNKIINKLKQYKNSLSFINLNAETKNTITYQNRNYNYQARNSKSGTHQLANTIGSIDGTLEFPTIAVLNPNNEIIYQDKGMIGKEKMLSIIETVSNLPLTNLLETSEPQ